MEDKNKQAAIDEMISRFGQWFAVVMLFIEKLLALNLTVEHVQKLLKDKNHPFWLAFNESTKLLVPGEIVTKSVTTLDDDTKRQIGFWGKLYKEHFGIDLDLTGVKIPERQSGFNWLVIVAEGLSINQVWAILKKHFKCWNPDRDLESEMQESERGKVKVTTARWFRDRPEADEETKNLSARMLDEPDRGFKGKGITIMERMLLEFKYFLETEKHLDIKKITLCNGSRYANGYVPSAVWDNDEFGVGWSRLDYRDDGLRSRVAVG